MEKPCNVGLLQHYVAAKAAKRNDGVTAEELLNEYTFKPINSTLFSIETDNGIFPYLFKVSKKLARYLPDKESYSWQDIKNAYTFSRD